MLWDLVCCSFLFVKISIPKKECSTYEYATNQTPNGQTDDKKTDDKKTDDEKTDDKKTDDKKTDDKKTGNNLQYLFPLLLIFLLVLATVNVVPNLSGFIRLLIPSKSEVEQSQPVVAQSSG